jgi:hypothetical protein
MGVVTVASGLLPVASATALHATSHPVAPLRVFVVAAIVLALSWLFYAAASRLFRTNDRASAATMVCFLAVFLYPLAWRLAWRGISLSPETFEILYLGLAGGLSVLIVGRGSLIRPLNAALLALVSVVLMGFIVVSLPQYRRSTFRVTEEIVHDVAIPTRHRPNVYHLLLDGLGRADVLRTRYALDLSQSVSTLKALGYRVEHAASSNYAQTYLSIASMLNAAYIDVSPARSSELSRSSLHEAIQNNGVFLAFRRAGYEITFLASDYSATDGSRLADTCWCAPTLFGEFESNVIYGTPFRTWLPGTLDYLPHDNRTERVLAQFIAPAPVSQRTPRYVFGHILSPHPPFTRRADGTFAPPRRAFTFFDGSMYPGHPDEYRRGYAEQTRYMMRRVVEIATALRRQDPSAVVIISGDHGPRLGFHAVDPRLTDVQEVLPVFLAVRWDSTEPARPVQSLVNLYREILRRYLSVQLTPLPDRSYVSSFRRPYELIEVDRRRLEP